MVRDVLLSDAERICEIYNYYVAQTAISFETECVDEDEIRTRISGILSAGYPYHVFVECNRVVGYCYLHKWNTRSAYDNTAEVSIYVDRDFRGKGIGNSLITRLIDSVDKKSIHTVIAGITLPNEASVGLHEKFGFKQISCFKEVGFKFGEWRNVGHWQLIF